MVDIKTKIDVGAILLRSSNKSNAQMNDIYVDKNSERKNIFGAGIGMAGRALYFSSQYASHILTARLLGAGGYGLYQLGISVVVLSSIVSSFGIPRVALKYIPWYKARRDHERLCGLLKGLPKIFVPLSIIISIILIGSGQFIAASFFKKQNLAYVIMAIFLSIPFFNSVMYMGSVGLAYGQVKLQVVGQYFLQPLFFLACIVALYFVPIFKVTPTMLGLIYSMSWFVSATTIFAWYLCLIKPDLNELCEPIYEIREWANFALPLISSDLVYRLRGLLDIFISGIMMSSVSLGMYAVCVRLAILPGIVVESFNHICAHRISSLYALGHIKELQDIYSKVNFTILSISLPAAIILGMSGYFLLGLFGTSFVSQDTVFALIILLMGQIINATAGTSEYMLMMTGNERKLLILSTISLFFNLILCVVLIPRFNIIGAAIANAVSLSLLNIAQVITIAINLKIQPYRAVFLSLVLPTIFSTAAAILTAKLVFFNTPIQQLIVTVMVFAITYLAVAQLFGVWRQGMVADIFIRD